MSQSDLVSVIIANYNGQDLLQSCLPSVISQDWPNKEIIVVDDASTDQSIAFLKENYPEVGIVALEKNQGYAAVNNRGVAAAKGDYILLLNNDISCPADCISRLMERLQAQPKCAIAGPKVKNLNMDMNDYPKNGTMSLTGNIIQNVFDDPAQIFGIAGCAVLYRKQLLGQPFDDIYEFFHEDVYLSWKARLMGYDVVRVPDVVVDHLGSASVSRLGEKQRYLMERNRRLNRALFFSKKTLNRLWFLLLIAGVTEWWADVIKGRSRQPVREARQWIAEHQRLIKEKRDAIQQLRQVEDEAIIKVMSGKITDNRHWPAKLINLKALLWCRLTGLKTWEITS